MHHPLMEGTKPISNQPQDTLNLAGHLCNRPCNVGGRRPMKIGPKRSQLGHSYTGGATAPPLSPLSLIFVWWVFRWSWIKPKWVLCPNSLGRLALLQAQVGASPKFFEQVGPSSLFPCTNQLHAQLECAFWCIFPCIRVCVLQNDNLQIHVELGQQ